MKKKSKKQKTQNIFLLICIFAYSWNVFLCQPLSSNEKWISLIESLSLESECIRPYTNIDKLNAWVVNVYTEMHSAIEKCTYVV